MEQSDTWCVRIQDTRHPDNIQYEPSELTGEHIDGRQRILRKVRPVSRSMAELHRARLLRPEARTFRRYGRHHVGLHHRKMYDKVVEVVPFSRCQAEWGPDGVAPVTDQL